MPERFNPFSLQAVRQQEEELLSGLDPVLRDVYMRRKRELYGDATGAEGTGPAPETHEEYIARLKSDYAARRTVARPEDRPLSGADIPARASYMDEGPALQEAFRRRAAEMAPPAETPTGGPLRVTMGFGRSAAPANPEVGVSVRRAGDDAVLGLPPAPVSPEDAAAARRLRALMEIGSQSPEKAAEVRALLEKTQPATPADALPAEDLPGPWTVNALQLLTPASEAAAFIPRTVMKMLPGEEPAVSKEYLDFSPLRNLIEQTPSRSRGEGFARLGTGMVGEVAPFFVPGAMPAQMGAARLAAGAGRAAIPAAGKAAGFARDLATGIVGFETPGALAGLLNDKGDGDGFHNPLMAPLRLVRDVLGDVSGSLEHPGVVNILRNAEFYADFKPEALDMLRRNLTPLTTLALPMALHKAGDAGKARRKALKEAADSGDASKVRQVVEETLADPNLRNEMDRAGAEIAVVRDEILPRVDVTDPALADIVARARTHAPPLQETSREATARPETPVREEGREGSSGLEGARSAEAARPERSPAPDEQAASQTPALKASPEVAEEIGRRAVVTITQRFNEWLESVGETPARTPVEAAARMAEKSVEPSAPDSPSMTERFMAWAENNPTSVRLPSPRMDPALPPRDVVKGRETISNNPPVPQKPGGFSLTALIRARMLSDTPQGKVMEATPTNAPPKPLTEPIRADSLDPKPAAPESASSTKRDTQRPPAQTPQKPPSSDPLPADVGAFTASMAPMRRSLAVKALTGKIRSRETGKVYTLDEYVRDKLASGYKVVELSWFDANAREKLEAEFNRLRKDAPIGNERHPQTIRYVELKTLLADPLMPKKTEKVLQGPDGGYLTSKVISKTAIDYADFLAKSQETSPAVVPPPKESTRAEETVKNVPDRPQAGKEAAESRPAESRAETPESRRSPQEAREVSAPERTKETAEIEAEEKGLRNIHRDPVESLKKYDHTLTEISPKERAEFEGFEVSETAGKYLPNRGDARKTPAPGSPERIAHMKRVDELDAAWGALVSKANALKKEYEAKKYGTKTRDVAEKRWRAAEDAARIAWDAYDAARKKYPGMFAEDRAMSASPVQRLVAAIEKAYDQKSEQGFRDAELLKSELRRAGEVALPIASRMAGERLTDTTAETDARSRALDAWLSDMVTQPSKATSWLDWLETKVYVERRNANVAAFKSEVERSGLSVEDQGKVLRRMGDYPSKSDFDWARERMAELKAEQDARAEKQAEMKKARDALEPAVERTSNDFIQGIARAGDAAKIVRDLQNNLMRAHDLSPNDALDSAKKYLQAAINDGRLGLRGEGAAQKLTKGIPHQAQASAREQKSSLKPAAPATDAPVTPDIMTPADRAKVEAAKETIVQAVKKSGRTLGSGLGGLQPFFNAEFAKAVADLATVYARTAKNQGLAKLLEYTENAYNRFKEFLTAHLPEHAQALGDFQGGKYMRRVWAKSVAAQHDLRAMGVAQKLRESSARRAFIEGGRVQVRSKQVSEGLKDARAAIRSLPLSMYETHGMTPERVERLKSDDPRVAMKELNEMFNPFDDIPNMSEAMAALEASGGKLKRLTSAQLEALTTLTDSFNKAVEDAQTVELQGRKVLLDSLAEEGAADTLADKGLLDLDRRGLTEKVKRLVGMGDKRERPFDDTSELHDAASGMVRYAREAASEPWQVLANTVGTDSRLFKLMWDATEGLREGDTKRLGLVMKAFEPVQKVLVDMGLGKETAEAAFRHTPETFDFAGIKVQMTQAEALDLYNHLRASGGNPQRLIDDGFKLYRDRHLKPIENLTEQHYRSFADKVPESIKRLSDAMFEGFAILHPEWAKAFEKIFFRRAGFRGPNYWGMVTDSSMRKSMELTLQRYLGVGDIANATFTKRRAEGGKEPLLIMDALGKYRSGVHAQARYAGMAPGLVKLRAIINHPSMRDAVVRKYGEQRLAKLNNVIETLSGFHERMGGPEVSAWNKAAKDLQASTVPAMLAGSLRAQVVSNMTGSLQYMKEVSARDWQGGVRRLFRDITAGRYHELLETMKENGYFHNRFETPTQRLLIPAEAKNVDPTSYKAIELMNMMVEWIGKNFAGRGDNLNSMLAYKIAEYRASRVKDGPTPSRAELLTEAEKLVRATQNPSSVFDMSLTAVNARKSVVGQAIFFIQNGAMKAAASWMRSLNKGFREGVKGTILAGTEVAGGMGARLAQWGLTVAPFLADDDKRKDPLAVSEASVAFALAELSDLIIPASGHFVRAIYAGSKGGKAPTLSPILDLVQAVEGIGATFWDEGAKRTGLRGETKTSFRRKFANAIVNLLRAMGPFLKVPPQFSAPLFEAMKEKAPRRSGYVVR